MAFDRNPPSQAEIDRWFLANPAVPGRTFELALVLGGTVSAGAYTAGALDFLIEALDAWTQLRDRGNGAAPQHKVVLRVVTGTSGGGVIAAIAARALNFEFDPIARDTPVGAGLTGNPFYDIWIKTLTLDRFLDPGGHRQRSLVAVERSPDRRWRPTYHSVHRQGVGCKAFVDCRPAAGDFDAD